MGKKRIAVRRIAEFFFAFRVVGGRFLISVLELYP